MAFVKIIPVVRCRKDGGVFIERSNRELAVFYLTKPERAVVIDNACPHAGGNLSGGEVNDGIVTCPWHHWQFDLNTGVCIHSDQARVRRYRAEIRDGMIWADLGRSVTPEPRPKRGAATDEEAATRAEDA